MCVCSGHPGATEGSSKAPQTRHAPNLRNPTAGAETLTHTAIAPQYGSHGDPGISSPTESLAVTLGSLSSVGSLVHPREGRGECRTGCRTGEETADSACASRPL